MHPRLAKVLRFAAAFITNLLLAVIGTAILDRLQEPFHLWHWHRWIFLRAFWLSFVLAGGLGFVVEHFWKTGAGKWVFIATSSLFGFYALAYAWGSNAPSWVPISGVWRHFSGADCIATRRARDCQDALIFGTTFVRGIGYSVGALVREMVRKQKVGRSGDPAIP